MERLIIVGNGFDLVHGFKTSYEDFSEYYSYNKNIKEFEQKVNSIKRNKKIPWYIFEKWIREITLCVHMKNFEDNSDYEKINIEIENNNRLFYEISLLLKEYLKNETNRNIKIIKQIKKYFTIESFTITFNYTNTVKKYTNNYYYIHGSISDDDEIILGYDNSNYPDSLAGNSLKNFKLRQKETLNFRRFLDLNGYIKKDSLLKEFEEHMGCLFSGKGEYLIGEKDEYIGHDRKNIGKVSKEIVEYAEKNKGTIFKEENDYSRIKEIIIIGHSLESDQEYLSHISKKIIELKKVVLLIYKGEPEISYTKKIKSIIEIFNIEEDMVFLDYM